jgi:hypothetical protein
LVGLLLFACLTVPATAQQYRADPVDNKARALRTNEKQWLGNPAAFAAGKAQFDEYFSKYYFPEMTHADDADLGKLGDLRYNLFRRYLWATTNKQLQADLTDMAFKKLGAVVISPEYHPAVRYNAILVLGMLDDDYGNLPKPSAKGNNACTVIVDSATTGERFPPHVILGAIIGLDRHAQLKAQLDPQTINKMTAALIKLVAHDQPIQQMDPEAYAWLRLKAADALAKLGSVGDKNSVHNGLIKLMSTTKSMDDRCAVAGMLDKLTYKDVKLDDTGTAEPLFALARDLGAAEDKRAQDFQNQYGGAGGAVARPMSRMMEMPGAAGVIDPSELETFPRRQVLARLTGLKTAVNKVKPSLPAETQAKMETLVKAIEPARTAVSSKEVGELSIADSMRKMAVAINKAVPASAEKAPAEKAPAAKASAEKALPEKAAAKL